MATGKRWLGRLGLIGIVFALVGAGYWAGSGHVFAPGVAVAADTCQTFPQTGKQVCGRFLEYWQANGGLAQQGLPLTDTFQETSEVDGRIYTVQYFERAVFEAHPENQRPYDVLLSLLGSQQYARKYPGGRPQTAPLAAGQTIIVAGSKEGLTFRIAVGDVQLRSDLPKGYGEPGTNTAAGRFLIVLFKATNLGSESGSIDYQTKVRDDKGRIYDLASLAVHRGAEKAYSRPSYDQTIQPGLNADVLMVFDVAPDSASFTVEPSSH